MELQSSRKRLIMGKAMNPLFIDIVGI